MKRQVRVPGYYRNGKFVKGYVSDRETSRPTLRKRKSHLTLQRGPRVGQPIKNRLDLFDAAEKKPPPLKYRHIPSAKVKERNRPERRDEKWYGNRWTKKWDVRKRRHM